MIKIHSYPYLIGTDLSLNADDVEQLVRQFEQTPDGVPGPLDGRSSVLRTSLDAAGPVVVKYYQRGGLIRHVVRNAYLRSGCPRSHSEYLMLKKVKDLGVPCPEPLVWAIRGGLFYKAFLVTGEIMDQQPLTDYCAGHPDLCDRAVEKTAENVAVLVKNRIHHVDLHPGNVLVDKEGGIHIIDFDKACMSSMKPARLMGAYIRRWKRAVKKHSLPDRMLTVFEQKLRS